MRVLIACDSFKDALAADAVCRAIGEGLRLARPDVEAIELPLSDGGEGALAVLRAPLGLTLVSCRVHDALSRPVTADYGLSRDGRLALIELAEAAGLQRIPLAERDPLAASTFGVGELLADARRRGARRAILAIGGSATNDAGVGAAAALGCGFFDAAGAPVRPDGASLEQIARIEGVRPPFERLDVLCDVTAPLYGPLGAAAVYSRQKGADDAMVARLDRGLRHLAALVAESRGGADLALAPGSGAAGGMAFGAMAFLAGQLSRGVDTVLDLVGFDAAVAACDLVITGEGRLDGQSAQGKLVQGVAGRAARAGKRVVALCGALSADAQQLRAIGVEAAVCINPAPAPLAEMLAATAMNLRRTAAELTL